jgi:putative transposase
MTGEKAEPKLPLSRKCELLEVPRSSFYAQRNKPSSKPADDELTIILRIDRLYTDAPYYGSRRITALLQREGFNVNRKRVQRLMRQMGIMGVAPGIMTSKPHPEHKVYPYLLRNVVVTRPNQVWSTDITYLPLASGTMYLVAIIDWFSRKTLAYRCSNTLSADFCVAALEEAFNEHGTPEIFNSDQGSQFTSDAFIAALETRGVAISMDSRGRAFDNIFIERFWRSLKYEWLYLHSFDDVFSMKASLAEYIDVYNKRRPHEALDYQTPDECYYSAPCGADFKLGLLSRSPAEMRPAASQPNACVNP